jgi:uncharacterized membrane protein
VQLEFACESQWLFVGVAYLFWDSFHRLPGTKGDQASGAEAHHQAEAVVLRQALGGFRERGFVVDRVPATVSEHHSAFGRDRFGRAAEASARFFGTPRYIVGQTIVVIAWITLNSVALFREWDPYPFILLNLAFSTQAAYAAPLILLAQTRQAERDARQAEQLERHRHEALEESLRREDAIEKLAAELRTLLERNTQLTREIHERVGR